MHKQLYTWAHYKEREGEGYFLANVFGNASDASFADYLDAQSQSAMLAGNSDANELFIGEDGSGCVQLIALDARDTEETRVCFVCITEQSAIADCVVAIYAFGRTRTKGASENYKRALNFSRSAICAWEGEGS